jgi:EpsI family protein
VDRETKVRIVAGSILVVFAVAGNYLRFAAPATAPAIGLDSYQLAGPDSTYEIEPIDGEFLDVLGAREVSFRTYRGGGDKPVWVFLGYFDRQKEGSQVHSPKHCYPGSGWSILEDGKVEAPWGTDRVKRLVVSNGSEKRLVYYWFQTADRILNDVLELKYYLTQRALVRHSQDVVFARVSTAMERTGGGNGPQDDEMAENLLREYSRVIEKTIGDMYRRRDAGGSTGA